MANTTAILLVGHGTRQPEADDLLRRIAAVLLQRTAGHVECAYSEWQAPTVAVGLDNCVRAGAAEVLVYPCFLSAGRHVHGELPEQLERAGGRHPSVRFRLAPHLGLAPGLAELAADALSNLLGQVADDDLLD